MAAIFSGLAGGFERIAASTAFLPYAIPRLSPRTLFDGSPASE